jgi:pyridoxal phosphate enzyme (YggS family)
MNQQILANVELFMREMASLSYVNRDTFRQISSSISESSEACPSNASLHQNSNKNLISPRLVAVSKYFPTSYVLAAYEAGITHFGENYVQEGVEKIKVLSGIKVQWHLIGKLQSNKAKLVAQHFDWVETIDSIELAERLDKYRPSTLPPLNVCIQVNIDSAPTKAGVTPAAAFSLGRAILGLGHLRLRGIMVMPDESPSVSHYFSAAKKLFDELRLNLFMGAPPEWFDTLSMGMSSDYQEAIAQGSTEIRIGRAIFGERQ